MTISKLEPCGMISGLMATRARTRDQPSRKVLISSGVTMRARHADSNTRGTAARPTTRPPCPYPITMSGLHRATPDKRATSPVKACLRSKRTRSSGLRATGRNQKPLQSKSASEAKGGSSKEQCSPTPISTARRSAHATLIAFTTPSCAHGPKNSTLNL